MSVETPDESNQSTHNQPEKDNSQKPFIMYLISNETERA